MADINGKRIAVLVTSGVEEVELTRPVSYFCSKGAEVTVITPNIDELTNVIHSFNHDVSGNSLYADALLSSVNPNDFDALYIPGGFSPDHLRLVPEAVNFVKAFANKLIFALCHGPQLLISADLVKGKTITSWPALEIDLKNAGANWVNQEVVADGNIITSRMPPISRPSAIKRKTLSRTPATICARPPSRGTGAHFAEARRRYHQAKMLAKCALIPYGLITCPPVTLSACPVIYELASPARKTTTLVISSYWQPRPRGTWPS